MSGCIGRRGPKPRNRILQADVILTLTAGQASRLLRAVRHVAPTCVEPAHLDLLRVVSEQCAKQGVRS